MPVARILPSTASGLTWLHHASRQDAALAAIAVRAEEFDRLLGTQYEPAAIDGLPSQKWLRASSRSLNLPNPERVALLLSDLGAQVTADEERSLAAAVVRGLSPHGAMVTVPRERLFSAEESKLVQGMTVASPSLRRVDLRQRVGQPMNYQGYLCAILKITRACNLRCTYCTDWREGAGATMPFSLQARAVQQSLSAGASAVDFVLHGGEPLLLGARGLVRLLALQEHFAPPGVVVRTQLQTNGTVLPKNVRNLLRLFNLRVSVSLDGTRQIHDQGRRTKSGEGTWMSVMEGITALHEDGTLSGILVVVTPDTLTEDPATLWGALVDTGTPSICFLAERPPPGQPSRVSRADYVAFLIRMEQQRAHSGHGIGIREVDGALRTLQGQQSGFCELAGNCVGHFVAIDPDGSVSHCDKYLGDPAYTLGNIVTQELQDVLNSRPLLQIKRYADAPLATVAECKWYSRCQGWCPHERYVDPSWGTDGCCGLGPLYDHLAQNGSS